jgi:voltage-gated potassium channel
VQFDACSLTSAIRYAIFVLKLSCGTLINKKFMYANTLKQKVSNLYEGDSKLSHKFRYGLLIADITTILFLITSTFFFGHKIVEAIDVIFGLYLLLDYSARIWISEKKSAFVINPLNLADLAALISFLAPLLGENFAFLRALRVLRLLRSYRLLNRLRQDFQFFKRNEDVILSSTNLFVFIFVMTELVFVTQVHSNPNVKNFVDAMYFTIATLTTTGFGDITLQGQSGRVLSIIIMIFGVSLFIRLIQTVFRPSKIRFKCTDCGLFLHDRDAVHCKHCGKVLDIPSDGEV